MNFLFLLFLFVLGINCVQQNIQPQVIVEERTLDQLYTWNFKKRRYERILNKNGKTCKSYPGGIYIQKFRGSSSTPKYEPVHKPKGANVKRPRK